MFTNGQTVQAADLNNFNVTSVTTSGDVTVGDDLSVASDATVGGALSVTGALTVGGVPISSTVSRDLCCGRLSLTSGSPVTNSDVSGATTLYWALYKGNQVALYSGSEWTLFALTELSIAVPATTAQMYDVFVNYNSGTPILSVTPWANDTTRATALTKQDGVYVKTGATGQRYVGSFRTTAVSGQTEDSFAKRYVWNYYHRQPREMRAVDATDSWNYTTATWRQARATTTNQLEFVIGVAEVSLQAQVQGYALNSGGASTAAIAVGLDSTSAPTAGNIGMSQFAGSASGPIAHHASLRVYPAVGYHFAAWLEISVTTSGTTTWYGDNGTTTMQAGISGAIDG